MQILSNATSRSDFEACVNLFQDFIKQNRSEVKDFTVAGVKTNTQNDTNKSTEADMSVEDRHCDKSEYSKLTNAQKLGLKLKREKRGQKKGSQGKRKQGEIKLSDHSIKAIASALRESNNDDSDEEDSDDEKSDAPPKKQKTNRTNKALSRAGKQ